MKRDRKTSPQNAAKLAVCFLIEIAFVAFSIAVQNFQVFLITNVIFLVALFLSWSVPKYHVYFYLAFVIAVILFCLGIYLTFSTKTVEASYEDLPPQTGSIIIDSWKVEGYQQPTAAVSADECAVSAKYPDVILQWCELITKYAATYNLDPNLVAAVMYQESVGDPWAYSGWGAVGLLQIMPRDGIAATVVNENGVQYFSSRPSMEELFDPEFNLNYGCNMLASLIHTFGSEREGLLHYGPDPDSLFEQFGDYYYYADKVLGIYQQYQ